MEESILYPKYISGPYSSANKCSDSPLWHEWYPRLRFAFFFIFLIYYVFGMSTLCFIARRRSQKAQEILKWYTYGTAIAFMSLYLLIATIGEGMLNCEKLLAIKYLKIWVASNVLEEIANVLFLGIVMLCAVPTMLKHSGITYVSLSQLIHIVLLSLVAIFMIVYKVIYNYNLLHSVTGQKIVDTKNGIAATYLTLYLVAALTASFQILLSCFEGFRKKLPFAGIFPYAGLLAFSIDAFALIKFIPYFAYRIVTRDYTKSASSAFVILGLVFQGCMYALLALLAMSKTLEADRERVSSMHDEKSLHPTNGAPEHNTVPIEQA